MDFIDEYQQAQQVALEKTEWQKGPSEEVKSTDSVQFATNELISHAWADFLAIEEQTLIEMGRDAASELDKISPLTLASAFAAFLEGWMQSTTQYFNQIEAEDEQE